MIASDVASDSPSAWMLCADWNSDDTESPACCTAGCDEPTYDSQGRTSLCRISPALLVSEQLAAVRCPPALEHRIPVDAPVLLLVVGLARDQVHTVLERAAPVVGPPRLIAPAALSRTSLPRPQKIAHIWRPLSQPFGTESERARDLALAVAGDEQQERRRKRIGARPTPSVACA